MNIIEEDKEEKNNERRRRKNIFDVPYSFFLILVVSESVKGSQNEYGTLMIPIILLFKTNQLFCYNAYKNNCYFICRFLTQLLVIRSV
jgi:hypothetical protein